MSQEPSPPVGTVPEEPTVVEWGTEQPRQPSRATRLLTDLRRDRRLVPVVAGIGAVALFGSLVSEWQQTTLDGEFFGEPGVSAEQQILTRVGDLGGWGSGYLVGVFLLAAAMALLLFGPRPVARAARVVALAVAGVLLTVLAAVWLELDDRSAALGPYYMINPEEAGITFGPGRGVPCGVAAVLALALAAYLAGRQLPAAATAIGEPAEAAATAVGEPAEAAASASQPVDEPPVWGWQRPRGGPAADAPPEAPLDLTVEPARPFTALPETRTDRP